MLKNLLTVLCLLVSTTVFAEPFVIETSSPNAESLATACSSALRECDLRVNSYNWRCRRNRGTPSLYSACRYEYGPTTYEYNCSAVATVDCR